MAKANRWVDFIRKWAKDNDTTYSCALSNPKCKDAYRAKYGIKKAVPARTERERMGLEDVDAKPAIIKKKKLKIREEAAAEQKKYDIVKKILMELDRLAGNYGSNRDPFGSVKDLMIIPEREGKTKKEIVDRALKYFKTHTNINASIDRSVLMSKLFAELEELIETENMGLEDVDAKPVIIKKKKLKIREEAAAKPKKKKKLLIIEEDEPMKQVAEERKPRKEKPKSGKLYDGDIATADHINDEILYTVPLPRQKYTGSDVVRETHYLDIIEQVISDSLKAKVITKKEADKLKGKQGLGRAWNLVQKAGGFEGDDGSRYIKEGGGGLEGGGFYYRL